MKVAIPAERPLIPVATGNPVQLVKTPDAGVPSAGVVRVGAVKVLFVRVCTPVEVTSGTPACWTTPVPLGIKLIGILTLSPVAERLGAERSTALVSVNSLTAPNVAATFSSSFPFASLIPPVRVMVVNVEILF
jgi:hypothetical protein